MKKIEAYRYRGELKTKREIIDEEKARAISCILHDEVFPFQYTDRHALCFGRTVVKYFDLIDQLFKKVENKYEKL